MKNLIALLLILVSGGVFYYITFPMYGEVQTLRAKKAEYDQALNSSQEAQKVRAALETKYNSISPENLNRLEGFLPNNIDNIRLIIEIDKIASQHNLTISNAQVTVAKETPTAINQEENVMVIESTDYGTGKFSFATSGTYEQYRSFIKDLEQSLRLINITSLSLSVAGSGTPSSSSPSVSETGEEIYSYTTTFDTYWLK